jgi:competence ComEA-like helix-hairpin-helix protein
LRFEISDFRFEIEDFRFEISNLKFAPLKFNFPQLWTHSQVRGLILIFSAIVLVLGIRLMTNRATIPDPQPPRGAAAAQLADRLDPNAATAGELAAIPGLGQKRADAIVAYRKQFLTANPGKSVFAKQEDLQHVRGIGPAISELLDGYLIFPTESSTRPYRGFAPMNNCGLP